MPVQYPADRSGVRRRFVFFCLMMFFNIVLYCNTSLAETAVQPHFRSVRWGMSKINVLSSEKMNPESFAGDRIVYRPVIFNQKGYLIYQFVDNQLIGARYLFKGYKMADIRNLVTVLKRKYGEPETDASSGETTPFFRWTTSDTRIIFRSDDGRNLWIEYAAQALIPLEKAVESEEREQIRQNVMALF